MPTESETVVSEARTRQQKTESEEHKISVKGPAGRFTEFFCPKIKKCPKITQICFSYPEITHSCKFIPFPVL